jgi:hypothetical protein
VRRAQVNAVVLAYGHTTAVAKVPVQPCGVSGTPLRPGRCSRSSRVPRDTRLATPASRHSRRCASTPLFVYVKYCSKRARKRSGSAMTLRA